MGNFIEEIIEDDLKEKRVERIITRFPPEPNGYLHIGHCKAICLNYFGTAVKYGGVFNLRFDDTNPEKEDDEYVNSIIEDVLWLGAKPENIFYASDYFQTMYECAKLLIKKDKAYVDDISAEEMRQMRGTLTEKGKESKNRNRPIEESLQLFEDMKNGLVEDGKLVLRAKIDMASPNINMRDPIIYRVLKKPHQRQGDKWCIYPMYDFAHPIEDAVEQVTHSICTLEFEDHRPLYDWVVNECEFEIKPHQYEFARLNIERTIMSKRYLKKLVDTGFVSGWDDPRMPTIAGLRRRGYTPSSLRSFCEKIGVAKANSEVETAYLESCVRDELNETADRVMAVAEPLLLKITNLPDDYVEMLSAENNPNNAERGSREISFSPLLYIEKSDFSLDPPKGFKRLVNGGTVRLKNAYIIKCTGYETDENGEVCTVNAEIIEGTRSGQETTVKAKGVVQWVDAKNCVDVTLRLFDYLLEEENGKTDFTERLNYGSMIEQQGKGEKCLENALPLVGMQFLRTGYFVKDPKENGLVFNRVVALKDSFKKK
jgi:glutaminyl-tRNA synthetase